MKRFVLLLLTSLFPIYSFAQKDVTTFLGIPVDGFKKEMRQKLIEKGFTPATGSNTDVLEGEFNGTDVNLFIGTNNNKVYRIMVCDAHARNEIDIKIRFNNLVRQFENNKRYTTFDQYIIPEEEDISYEILVHKKKYEALFYQTPDMSQIDTLALKTKVKDLLLEKYSLEQIENPTETLALEIQSEALKVGLDLVLKKPVWFIISEHFGEYYITMFYDNVYNQANGEDL